MTPKEKAEELIYKMWLINPLFRFLSGERNYDHAKQCALIAVDEIIKSNTNVTGNIINFDYWQEVKQEIEKL